MQNLFNEITTYQKLSILLDDGSENPVEIPIDHIVDSEIHWDMDRFEVAGYIKINDIIDVINTFDITNLMVKIYINDVYEDKSVRWFKVIELDETKVNSQYKSLTLKIQDEISYLLKNTYISKSYSDIKISDIFSEELNKLELKGDIKNEISSNKIYDFITVPANISILDFVLFYLNKENVIIYQNRRSLKYIDMSSFDLSLIDKHENSFRQKDLNSLYMNQIITYDAKTLRKASMNKTYPNTTEYIFDIETKTYKKVECNLSEVKDNLVLNNIEHEYQEKSSIFNYTDVSYKDKFKNLFRLNNIDLTVPGNTKYNIPNKVAEVILTGNHNNEQPINDLKMSGYYYCNKVIDKFLHGNKYIQKISMYRYDLTKGK